MVLYSGVGWGWRGYQRILSHGVSMFSYVLPKTRELSLRPCPNFLKGVLCSQAAIFAGNPKGQNCFVIILQLHLLFSLSFFHKYTVEFCKGYMKCDVMSLMASRCACILLYFKHFLVLISNTAHINRHWNPQ